MGIKERGGDMRAVVIPNVKKSTLRDVTLRNVKEGSTVSTDELMSYGLLEGDGYKHGVVTHSQKELVALRLARWRDVFDEPRRKLLGSVQAVGSLDAYSRVVEAHAPLSG
jgi:transposase-like protein